MLLSSHLCFAFPIRKTETRDLYSYIMRGLTEQRAEEPPWALGSKDPANFSILISPQSGTGALTAWRRHTKEGASKKDRDLETGPVLPSTQDPGSIQFLVSTNPFLNRVS